MDCCHYLPSSITHHSNSHDGYSKRYEYVFLCGIASTWYSRLNCPVDYLFGVIQDYLLHHQINIIMRGIVTAVIFLLILSGASSFLLIIGVHLIVEIEPTMQPGTNLQWYTWVILSVFVILSLKVILKLSRWVSHSLCDALSRKSE